VLSSTLLLLIQKHYKGYKGLPETNPLASYEHSSITAVKSPVLYNFLHPKSLPYTGALEGCFTRVGSGQTTKY
jgi:hypothetical protein